MFDKHNKDLFWKNDHSCTINPVSVARTWQDAGAEQAQT